MSLAALLLICAQETQRSGKERDELVRSVQASPLADDGARVRETRDREAIGRPPRLEPRELGFPDVPGRVHDSRARVGNPGVSLGLWPEDRLHSDDDLGGPGAPLAPLTFNLSHHTPDGHGMAFYASRSRFPEPLPAEYGADRADEFSSSVDDRIGIDGWLALGSNMELYARAEQWSDRDDSGGTVRARAIWRDAFGADGPFLLETYVDSGKSLSATGLRASGSKRFEFGAIGLSWDSTDYDAEGIDEKLLQHAVRADVAFLLGRHWSLGVYAQSRFGDERDALQLGFALQLGID